MGSSLVKTDTIMCVPEKHSPFCLILESLILEVSSLIYFKLETTLLIDDARKDNVEKVMQHKSSSFLFFQQSSDRHVNLKRYF